MRFLRLLPSDLRESIEGDLVEEYARVRARRGVLRARVWFWWNAVRLAALFQWERGVHGRPLPPIADEAPQRITFVEGLRQDLGYGLRMLRRQPGFTIVAVLALTLGIGANTAIFSIVDAVLWRPLPYPDSERIVFIGEQRPKEGRLNGPVAPADYLDWRAMSTSFSAMASATDFALNLTGGVDPQRVRALAVSPAFFDALGVSPARGRPFAAAEEDPGRSHVAILTDGLWRGAFGARPDIVGSRVVLNAESYDVVGVLPASFWWPTRPQILVPRAFEPDERTQRAVHMFPVVARLARGVTPAQARADMDAIGRQIAERHPDTNRAHFPHIASMREIVVGETGQSLLALLGAVVLVLLIACANVSTLLVARATARRKEIAIRLTLGAARGRLIRQLLTESVLLAAIGGGCGMLLAVGIVSATSRLLPARLLMLPGLDRIAIDLRVLVAATVATAGASVLFGLVPAFTASADRTASALSEGGRSGGAGAGTRRARSVLVIVEVALSLVLLVGAALLMVSFHQLTRVSPGFQAEHVVTMRVTLPLARYREHSRVVGFYDALVERLQGVPGMESAGAVTMLPFSGADQHANFIIENRTAESPFPVRSRPMSVTPEYLQTLRIPLVRGRYLTPRDADGAPEVVIINDAAARRYWPGEDPVGRRITFDFGRPRWLEIVGVVGDVKHRGLDADAEPEMYLSSLQTMVVGSVRAMDVVIRTSRPLAAVAPIMRAAVSELDRDQAVGPVRPMEDLVDESVAPARLNLWLLVAFALLALVLTAEGLYGVMAFLVTQRSQEIGIRMALGASPSRVLRLVLRQAATMMFAGVALGLAGAFGLSRFLASQLFGVSPTEPAIYVAVCIVIALVALIAIAVPASRAARVNPLTALRS